MLRTHAAFFSLLRSIVEIVIISGYWTCKKGQQLVQDINRMGWLG